MSKEIDVIDITKNRLSEIAALKYVAEDEGQLDMYSSNFPVRWPCALIDISDMNFSNKGRARGQVQEHPQMAAIVFTIRVANLRTGNTNKKAPTAQKAQANSIWNVLSAVHLKLHGWEPTEFCAKLIRTSQKRTRRDDGVQEYVITYTGTLNDV